MSHLGLRFCQCQRSCQSKNCDWQNPRWYELKLICKLLDTQGIQVLGKGGQVLGKGIQVLGQGVQEPGYSMLPSTVYGSVLRDGFLRYIFVMSWNLNIRFRHNLKIMSLAVVFN